jgi:hypothetical protein
MKIGRIKKPQLSTCLKKAERKEEQVNRQEGVPCNEEMLQRKAMWSI